MTGVRAKRISNMESKWAACSVGVGGTERPERLAGPSLLPAPRPLGSPQGFHLLLHAANNRCPILVCLVTVLCNLTLICTVFTSPSCC